MIRAFRDGHKEEWWALEVDAGPYSPEKAHRALVVTTDPERLPRLGTWYLITNQPAPGSERSEKGSEPLTPASLAEVVRLYGLRMWAEQSYKQVKHALGWSDYQARSDVAIRRHWQLVMCAFSFCWWACGEWLEVGVPPGIVLEEDTKKSVPAASSGTTKGRGEKERGSSSPAAMATSAEASKGVAGALGNAVAILEGVHRQGPTQRVEGVA